MYAVKKTQKHITRLLGSPTEKVKTLSGSVFYLNDISKAIAMVSRNCLGHRFDVPTLTI